MKLFTKYDFALVLSLLAVIVILLFPRGTSSHVAEIYFDGNLIRTMNLKEDQQVYLDVGMLVKVEGGRISVVDSDCPEKLCVSQGAIDKPNIPIVCVPNKIIIRIPSGISDIDVITQ